MIYKLWFVTAWKWSFFINLIYLNEIQKMYNFTNGLSAEKLACRVKRVILKFLFSSYDDIFETLTVLLTAWGWCWAITDALDCIWVGGADEENESNAFCVVGAPKNDDAIIGWLSVACVGGDCCCWTGVCCWGTDVNGIGVETCCSWRADLSSISSIKFSRFVTCDSSVLIRYCKLSRSAE